MYKAVIFDLDGTLTDTLESLAYSSNRTLNMLGYPDRPTEEYKYFAGDGPDTLIRRILIASGDKECKDFDKAYELYKEEFAKDSTYKVKPYDGIVDLINELKKRNLKLAVLTNKNYERALEVINTFFGDDVFDMIIGQMDGIIKKPHPNGALKIACELNIKTSECLYLGDTNVDMQTANAAGMCAVGVLWGFRERDELEENGAKYIIEKPQELLELL